MTERRKFYWDACTWIALINQEAGKEERCRSVIEDARNGLVEIWTSSLTLAEVFKKKCDEVSVGLPSSGDASFEDFILQDFVTEVNVDHNIGALARNLLRMHAALKKPADSIHLATAIMNNLDELHTFDGANLIKLDGQLKRDDGRILRICEPPLPVQASLSLGDLDLPLIVGAGDEDSAR